MTYNLGYTLGVRAPTPMLKNGHVLCTCNTKAEMEKRGLLGLPDQLTCSDGLLQVQ